MYYNLNEGVICLLFQHFDTNSHPSDHIKTEEDFEKLHDEEIAFPTAVGAKYVLCEHCSNIFNISF